MCARPLICLRLRPSIHLAALTRERLKLHRYDGQPELRGDPRRERYTYADRLRQLLAYSTCFRYARKGGPNLPHNIGSQLVVDDVTRHVWRHSKP